MSERAESPTPIAAPPKRSNRNLALLLIGAGVLILIYNSGILRMAFWSVVVPIALAAVGADLITERRQRRHIAIGAMIALAISLSIVGGARLLNRQQAARVAAPDQLRTIGSVKDVNRVAADVELTAGELKLMDLPKDSDLLATLGANGELAYENNNGVGQLQIAPGNWNSQNLQLKLTPLKPLDLKISMGAGNVTPLDFSKLQLATLKLELGAGNAEIKLPKQGVVQIDVSGGVGNTTIDVPEELAARIEVQRAFGRVDVPDRFQRQDDNVYVTSNYKDSTANRVTIRIEKAGGNLTIK